jgi:hypothetical protein
VDVKAAISEHGKYKVSQWWELIKKSGVNDPITTFKIDQHSTF